MVDKPATRAGRARRHRAIENELSRGHPLGVLRPSTERQPPDSGMSERAWERGTSLRYWGRYPPKRSVVR
jgi:hypothetical protein